MAPKRYDAVLADFDARYSRWVAAQESGDEVQVKAAAAALPTLNARLLAKLAAADEDEDEHDPEARATQKRLLVLVSEINADEARRRRKRREAQQRRRDRTILIERTAELPTTCVRCGVRLEELKTTGRPRLYCSPASRKAAYEDRRAHRDSAVKVQLVEKVITEVRERRIDVPHSRSVCIQSVLNDDDALVNVIWTLIDQLRDRTQSAFSTEQARFWDLYNNVEVLHEALARRAETDQSPAPATAASMNRDQRNLQRMTRPHPSPGAADQ